MQVYQAVKNIAKFEMGFLWLWLQPTDLGLETATKSAAPEMTVLSFSIKRGST